VAVFLQTERMTLRPFTENDTENLYALDNDPGVMRYLDGGRPASRERICEEILPRMIRHHPCLSLPGFWAAEEKANGEFLGWFEFRPLKDDSAAEVELGYRLRTATWGRGYATEGSLALIAKGFAELGVERVMAQTMTVNSASRRVMEKAGLRYVRTFFQDWPDAIDGSEQGEVEYELRKEEWAALRG
jgi:RimJ/RimL family protein N-acetyltransferase